MRLEEYIKKSPLYDKDKFIVLYRGVRKPKILFIGEAPGKEENKIGRPFIGRSGTLLNRWVETYHLQNKYGITNAVPLIPLTPLHAIRKPTTAEIEYFRPFLKHMINKYEPKLLILLGDSATTSVLGKKISEAKQGDHFMEIKKGYKIPAASIYHPAYYLRNGRDGLDDFGELYENKILTWIPEIKE